MPPEDQNAAGAASKENQTLSNSIKVGEKEYRPEDIQAMLAQQAEATKVLQSFGEVQRAASRYGLTPEDFVRQAEGSFAAVADLIDKRVIDEHGRLVSRGQASENFAEPDEDPLEVLLGTPQARQASAAASAQVPDARTKALAQALGELRGFKSEVAKELEALKRDNTALLRYNLAMKLKQSFPDLAEDEVDLVLERARGDRTKSLADHAALLVGQKKALKRSAQEELAKTLGIENLDEHLNKLKQQQEGGTGALFKGKKFSFRPKGDEVSPRAATEAFLNAQFGR